MRKKLRVLGFVLLASLLAFLILPFLVPVPPLQGLPAGDLAEPDSRFVSLQGLDLHYKQLGQGSQNLVLLHGFLANTFTWHKVIQPLAESTRVVAFDRPAFGLSARPLTWESTNPYAPETQTDMLIGLMDHLGMETAVLVGHSAGGTVAVYTALRYPERVEALVLVDPAIYTAGGAPAWIKPLLALPQMRRLGPLVLRRILKGQSQSSRFLELAWHDPCKISPETMQGYLTTFRMQDWDKALWLFTLSSRDLKLGERLDELAVPVLVITGDDDRIVPVEDSMRLAKELPQAQLVVISDCGHVPMEECPQPFLEAVADFLADLKEEE